MMAQSAQFFYIVAAIFGISTLTLLAVSVAKIRPFKPVLGWALIVPAMAGLAYFAMGKGIGVVEINNNPVKLTRYIDWMITTPILLYLLTFAMIPDPKERVSVALGWGGIMILVIFTGLLADILSGTTQALLFMVSSLAYLGVLYHIVDHLLALDKENIYSSGLFWALLMAWVILILWTGYPIVWVMGSGSINVISIGTSTVVYAVLDVITKVGFAVLLMQYLRVKIANRDD